MKKNQTLSIVLLIVGTIFIAGCISQNNWGNSTIPVTTTCPPSGNVTPYIIINPIEVHYQGDYFEINGTTNLGFNKKILYSIDRTGSATPIPVPFGSSPAFIYTDGSENITYGDILIVKGECNEQKWLFWLNTSGHEYDDSTFYIVHITAPDNSIYNSTSFDLRSSYLRPSAKRQEMSK